MTDLNKVRPLVPKYTKEDDQEQNIRILNAGFDKLLAALEHYREAVNRIVGKI